MALVVSELVTNAVRHAAPLPGGVIEVSVSLPRVTPTAVQVRVTDGGGPTLPALVRASDEPVVTPLSGGRGLSIVSTVVDQWGVEVDPSGPTTVWVELEPHRLHTGVSGRPA